eukprot:8520134-Ditylum_brightwellii.AAC.1
MPGSQEDRTGGSLQTNAAVEDKSHFGVVHTAKVVITNNAYPVFPIVTYIRIIVDWQQQAAT